MRVAWRLDRPSWGAILAGFFVGVGTLFLLLSLGAAIGLTSVSPGEFYSWKHMGMGVGIWGGISSIIASFLSAWTVSRVSATASDKTGGALHGTILWGLTLAVGLGIGSLAVASAVNRSGARAASQLDREASSAPATRGDPAGAVLAPELQQRGQDGLRQEQGNTTRLDEAVAADVRKGAWGTFLVALLTLIASAAGGALGAQDRVRRAVADEHTAAIPNTVLQSS